MIYMYTYLCVDVRDLLDRASVARASVLGGDDAAISALSELLHELVLRIDDERRVERGEAVSLHDLLLARARLCIDGCAFSVKRGRGCLVVNDSKDKKPGIRYSVTY
jgi:hypothetical protein